MQPQPSLSHPLYAQSFPTADAGPVPVFGGVRLLRESSDQEPSGDGSGSGSGGRRTAPEERPSGSDSGSGSGSGEGQPVWGSQWSRRQPPRRQGAWGGSSGSSGASDSSGSSDSGSGDRGRSAWGSQGAQGSQGPQGSQGGGQSPFGAPPERRTEAGGPGGLRWDPTDPNQRRARYALLSGMWAVFFTIFQLWPVSLLLGVLALYWGISSLRGKAKRPADTAAASGADSAEGGRQPATDAFGRPVPQQPAGAKPQTRTAVVGVIAGGVAVAVVAMMLGVQFAYRDYFTCRDDALTQASEDACLDKLPKPLRDVFGEM
ncbi:hypothetical protein SRB5_69890 [Streptomyces sp. RB5]|uniref:Integral membrane protein n=1 Tax=Streptomyces smaragdinus TaxID=2585196 RepID=A0A7K0CTG6_9ACTN|nr:hypothetical protein [Streptomyces smaragdinus]MQY16786.1 hypothetical protein [Streptomyces smaragdinus]